MTALYPALIPDFSPVLIPDFSPARTYFESIIQQVQDEDVMQLPHDDVETLLEKAGREIVRRLFQSHLDLRSYREANREPPAGSDGVPRRHRRGTSRPLRTVLGEVEVHRLSFTAKEGSGGLRPLDGELNLPAELFSFGLRRTAASFVIDLSFDSAVQNVNTYTSGSVSKRQLEEMIMRSAVDFDAFYEAQQLGRSAQGGAHDNGLLILSTDGKGIVMRHDSLRDATKKAAEKARHKLGARLSAGEKKNRKRMAEVATVYDIEPQVRRPEDIMASDDPEEQSRPRPPRPTNKRVWASVDKSLKEVVAQAFEEALSRDPERRRTWVYMVDGNREQIRVAKRLAREHGITLLIIIDFIHVLEYIWKAAWSFFDKGDPRAEAWVRERANHVLQGKASTVAAGIRRAATMRKLDKKKRKGADACADYLLKKKSMLRYDEYLALGTPIATGVIEGACRHLVNDRLGITGARWGLEGAEAVLKLRALRSSGDLDAYWDYHRRQEWERNHRSKFADGQLADLKSAA